MEIIKTNLSGIVEEINDHLAANQSFDSKERALFFLSDYYRRLGIAYYLGDMDTEQYFHFLTLSAQTRKKLLILSKVHGRKPGRFQCASHIASFFDAIVSDDFDTAKEIAMNSTDYWIENEEYEEDFHYARLLYNWILADNV